VDVAEVLDGLLDPVRADVALEPSHAPVERARLERVADELDLLLLDRRELIGEIQQRPSLLRPTR